MPSLPMLLICVTRVAEAMVDNCCKKLISFKSLEATAGIQLHQAIEGAHLEETLKNKLSEAIDHLLTAEDVSGSGSAQTAVEESSSVGASPSERSILIILMKSTLLSFIIAHKAFSFLAHTKSATTSFMRTGSFPNKRHNRRINQFSNAVTIMSPLCCLTMESSLRRFLSRGPINLQHNKAQRLRVRLRDHLIQ